MPISSVTCSPISVTSLAGDPVDDHRAKRQWSRSYLALTRAMRPDPKPDKPEEPYTGRANRLVNWINVQAAPTMLEPYTAGAARMVRDIGEETIIVSGRGEMLHSLNRVGQSVWRALDGQRSLAVNRVPSQYWSLQLCG